jgi:hypothetical protein
MVFSLATHLKFQTVQCALAVFADDIAIYTSHSDISIVGQRLQNAVKLFQLYYSSWKLKIIHPSHSVFISPKEEVHGTCPVLILTFVVPLFLALTALSS